jgi:hypothetical protein
LQNIIAKKPYLELINLCSWWRKRSGAEAMKGRQKFESWFELLSQAKAGDRNNKELTTSQVERLLSAYEKISSPQIREEFIGLVQAVGAEPELLMRPRRKRSSPRTKYLH